MVVVRVKNDGLATAPGPFGRVRRVYRKGVARLLAERTGISFPGSVGVAPRRGSSSDRRYQFSGYRCLGQPAGGLNGRAGALYVLSKLAPPY
ncbi:hypothetical protein Pyn_17820 [Prunus yedoensis var. nudiflora]|uniref:Uncharacterized protein n=1 Tax=Prunus yedoensis var. nudiflora TaxID=2094558 RepID=A0A314YE45_PRUYE|nr:hypothetical protein Pyn_17820 [Prunus yedoensis var. nudiflora]